MLPPTNMAYLFGAAADEAEVGVVGTAAAVRAAGHAEEDGLVFEAEFAQVGVDLVQDAGQDALGFAERKAAGGQGDAGVSDLAGAGHAVGVDDAVFGEDGIDGGLLPGATSAMMRLVFGVTMKGRIERSAISLKALRYCGLPSASAMRPMLT